MWEDAGLNHREAMAIAERRFAADPKAETARAAVAEKAHSLGTFYQLMNQSDEAEKQFVRSIELRVGLIEEFPAIGNYKSSLAADYIDVGLIYMNSNRPDHAQSAFQKAEALLTELVEQDSKNDNHRLTLAAAYVNHSQLLRNDHIQEALNVLNKD